LAAFIPDAGSLAAGEGERKAGIGRDNMPLIKFGSGR
jgi:hypothetical protein